MRSYYPTGGRWKRAWATLRHESFRTFFFKAAAEAGYRRVVLLERPLDASLPEPPGFAGVAFVELGEERFGDYLAARPERSPAQVASLASRGHRCYALERDGRIVSTCWATTRPQHSDFLDADVPIGEHDVYLTDAWTHPDHRGHGYAQALCLHQLRHYRAQGCRRALRMTIPENYSALRAHAKSGFRPAGVLGTVRIGGFRREFRRTWPGARP